jgi:hypothetical protein
LLSPVTVWCGAMVNLAAIVGEWNESGFYSGENAKGDKKPAPKKLLRHSGRF